MNTIYMKYIINLFFLISLCTYAQKMKLKKTIPLSKKVSETSGLLWYNKNLITHNDSGDKPKLYVIDEKDGSVKRTVKVKNAENVDWEDLAQDKDFIYVADTGNNDGIRTDLVIYKIAKKDFDKHDEVEAEKIYIDYQDNKIEKKGRNNYDCEAITVYNDQLLLLSKNWLDFKTYIYTVPLKTGKYSIKSKKCLEVNSLITGIDYHSTNNKLLATGYNRDYESHLFQFFDILTDHASFKKIDVSKVLEGVNQIEGIAFKDSHQVYLSRELNKKKIKGKKQKSKEKLFLIKIE